MFSKYKNKIISIAVFIGVLGAFLGNLNHFPAFINHFTSEGNKDPDIHGIWLSKYSYPVTRGVLDVYGTTEYFKNNNDNFIGEIGLRIKSEGNSVYILYNVDGTGVWQADSESLTIRLDDIRSWPKSMLYNGKPVDMALSKSGLSRDFPKIEESLPAGVNEEFKIVDLNEEKFVLEADAPKGDTFDIEMIKPSKRFQR